MSLHFSDIPVYVQNKPYARYVRSTVADKLTDSTYCIHNRTLAQECRICRKLSMSNGMVRDDM